MKKIILSLLTISLAGCSLYQKTPPIFVPPVGYTPTPLTQEPEPTQSPTIEPEVTQIQVLQPTPTLYTAPTETLVPTPYVEREPIVYHAQAGDTLSVVATHFGVRTDQIQSNQEIPEESFINPGTLLVIPQVLVNTT